MSGFFTGGVSRLTLTSRHPCYLGEITIPETKFVLPYIEKYNAVWSNGATIDILKYPEGTIDYVNKTKELGVSQTPDRYDSLIIHNTSGKIYVGEIKGELFFLPRSGFIMPDLKYIDGKIIWIYSSYVARDNGRLDYMGNSPFYKGFVINSVSILYGAR